MFNAKFVNRKTGISKKTGKDWYQLELIANTIDGGAAVLQCFCTKSAYDSAIVFSALENCEVLTGVTADGFISINQLRKVGQK